MYFHDKTGKAYIDMLYCNTKKKEDTFLQKLYEFVFAEYGNNLDAEKEAKTFLKLFPQHKNKSLFPEVIEVLETCKSKNMFLGIISDCGPYLKDSIIALNIDSYFSRYIAAAEVGAMKPDKQIFDAAIHGLGIEPNECIFIDDNLEEANGAREYGFLSFHINRQTKADKEKEWEIDDLTEILNYI